MHKAILKHALQNEKPKIKTAEEERKDRRERQSEKLKLAK